MPRCFDVLIPEPCQVGWQNMQGDDTVRFCGLCSKNVYNLSDMTEDEVSDLIEVRGTKICVSIRRRADGTVYTDNCPRQWRVMRDFFRARLPIALVAFAWVFQQSAVDAQGLVGAPVDPMYGQSGGISRLVDYGYDAAQDLACWSTVLSAVFMTAVAYWRIYLARVRRTNDLARKGRCVRTLALASNWTVARWTLAMIVVPMMVYNGWMFFIQDPLHWFHHGCL